MPTILTKKDGEIRTALTKKAKPFVIYFKNKDNMGAILCPDKQTVPDTTLRGLIQGPDAYSGALNSELYYGHAFLNGTRPKIILKEGTNPELINGAQGSINAQSTFLAFAKKIGYPGVEKFDGDTFQIGGLEAKLRKEDMLEELESGAPILRREEEIPDLSAFKEARANIIQARGAFGEAIKSLKIYLNSEHLQSDENGVLTAMKAGYAKGQEVSGLISKIVSDTKSQSGINPSALMADLEMLKALVMNESGDVFKGMAAAAKHDEFSSNDINEIQEEFFGRGIALMTGIDGLMEYCNGLPEDTVEDDGDGTNEV